MYDTILAKHFKERDNPVIEQPVVGTVISLSPFKISIYNGDIVLNENIIYVCQHLFKIKGNIKIDPFSDSSGDTHNVNNNFEITRDLKVGDKVMCVPTDNGQKYFIVDKVM